MILDDLAAGLYTAGARRIAWVTGHYAQGHEVELYEAALRAMEDHPGLTVFAATPLEPIGDDDLLDHAGRSETAQMLHVAPHLVDLTQLPETLDPKEDAVLGDHPRRATAEEGHRLFQQGLTAWTSWLESDPETLRAWYGRAFDRYQPYIDAYYEGSWEEAVQKWWSTK
jgi:creatinine amidohydrolase